KVDAWNESVGDTKYRAAIVVVQLVVESPSRADQRAEQGRPARLRPRAAEHALSRRKPVRAQFDASIDRADLVRAVALAPAAGQPADVRLSADVANDTRDAE